MPGKIQMLMEEASELLSGESTHADDSDASSEGDSAPRVHIRHMLSGMAASLVLGCMLGYGAVRLASGGPLQAAPAALIAGQVDAGGRNGWQADTDALDKESERGICGPTTQSFAWISTFDPMAQKAVHRAFDLANRARRDCQGGAMPPLPGDTTAFLRGDTMGRHYVQVHHRFSSSCESETFKLAFHVAGAVNGSDSNVTSFIIQAHSMSTSDSATIAAADFAAEELAAAMRREGCLPNGTAGFNVSRVLRAVALVIDGLAWQLTLELTPRDGGEAKVAELAVVEACADGSGCVRHLGVPQGGPCKAFDNSTVNLRHLGELQPGATASDPTELFDAQRLFLFKPRRLQDERKPITVRHIKAGEVPSEFDPRGHVCFQQIMVYNQGHCASCYAAAAAQMIGLRKCLSDNGGARGAGNLQVLLDLPAMATDTARCEDDGEWSAAGLSGGTLSCQWFAANDPGCKNQEDRGQKTHCQKVCGTCRPIDRQNPWNGALYAYMPSTADLSQCSRDTEGNVRGCQGGSPGEIWNNWMRELDRPLWNMRHTCLPDRFKCSFETNGFTNPSIENVDCGKFANYDLWHRPCNCIPESEKPRQSMCPAEAPPQDCAHEVPAAFFEVKTVAHGLSIPEAVLNMQRHILEGGPIFVSVEQTRQFMNWDHIKTPVYTGGATIVGQHAMLAAGWGNLAGTDYWLVRNSWSPRWGEKGYCKFQRGINLDGIEDVGVDASMPSNDFQDLSEPVCDFSYMRWQWWIMGDGTVTNYTGFIDIKCDKACSLNVAFSNIVEHESDPVADGITRSLPGVEGGTTTFPINLLRLGFGTKMGDMHISISAVDSVGNAGKTTAMMSIPPAGS